MAEDIKLNEIDGEENHIIQANDVIMLEGFDIVGKNTFVNSGKVIPKDYVFYKSDFGLIDDTIGRTNSWTVAYSVLDFLNKILSNNNLIHNCNIVLNQGIMSSFVYERLYRNKSIDQRVIDYYKQNDFFINYVEHIYIRHHSLDTALQIYTSATNKEFESGNPGNTERGTFNSFSDYWLIYSSANQLYKNIYEELGIKPRIFEAFPNGEFREVSEF